jgi:uncharacterized LabA/DUF88 family protein
MTPTHQQERSVTDTRLKIAVFIDFDNIEIGVKTTMNQNFDVGVVLEAIKERGEVVTKVAYSDWKRAGDYSRQLSHHAIRMVQRNLTPGGDKNGADINLALDALEMAFTHDHINAFVIVGGDSDFITLVEKLKQYDKKVFVVGGRQFTSLVMQKNCHEFIAYENLAGARRPATGGRTRQGSAAVAAATDVEKALPIVKRALKVLSDREVTPQLGLLKSTLLQLDSTFSERDYGASTFRDFIEKVAERGIVTLKQAGRSVLVELSESALGDAVPEHAPTIESIVPEGGTEGADVREDRPGDGEARPVDGEARRTATTAEAGEAVKLAERLFEQGKQPRWPMYIRQIRQYLRNADESFDERKLGFGGIVDFLRACQREGLLRLERDRQGVMRVFPGPSFPKQTAAASQDEHAAAPGAAPEPSFDGGEPVVIVEEPRFHRITDDVVDEPSETVIETVPVEATTSPADYEEDLSVGPGNVAGRETHTMTTTAKVGRPGRHPVRKGAPRTPKSAPVARTRRAPRARKPKE